VRGLLVSHRVSVGGGGSEGVPVSHRVAVGGGGSEGVTGESQSSCWRRGSEGVTSESRRVRGKSVPPSPLSCLIVSCRSSKWGKEERVWRVKRSEGRRRECAG
jgi:hypothetical protein